MRFNKHSLKVYSRNGIAIAYKYSSTYVQQKTISKKCITANTIHTQFHSTENKLNFSHYVSDLDLIN